VEATQCYRPIHRATYVLIVRDFVQPGGTQRNISTQSRIPDPFHSHAALHHSPASLSPPSPRHHHSLARSTPSPSKSTIFGGFSCGPIFKFCAKRATDRMRRRYHFVLLQGQRCLHSYGCISQLDASIFLIKVQVYVSHIYATCMQFTV
jgi:hypothetical protein